MLIRRNVEPKVLMASLLAASRTWRKKAPPARPRLPGGAGRIGTLLDGGSGHRLHCGGEERHV